MCLDTSSYAVGKWAQCSKHWYNCNWLWWLSGFTSNGEDGFPHLNSYARGKIGYFWGRKSIYLSIFNLFMYILQWSIIWMTAFLNKNKNKAGLFLWGYWVFLQKEVFRGGLGGRNGGFCFNFWFSLLLGLRRWIVVAVRNRLALREYNCSSWWCGRAFCYLP